MLKGVPKILLLVVSSLVIALSFSLALSGCGEIKNEKEKDSEKISSDSAEQLRTQLPDNPPKLPSPSERATEEGQVVCNDPKICDESVAMLVASTPSRLTTCTSFVIASDIIATSSSCIPPDLRRDNSDCSERIWAFFPSVSTFEAERVSCKEVIKASETRTVLDQNFAFIRLAKSTKRIPLKISFEGLRSKTVARVYQVKSSLSDAPYGEISTAKCKVIQNSLALPEFNHPNRPLVTLSNCSDSRLSPGSPIIGPDGTVRAITSGEIIDTKAIEVKYAKRKIRTDTGVLPPLIVATNLSCVSSPIQESRTRLSEKCFPPKDSYYDEHFRFPVELLANEYNKIEALIAQSGMRASEKVRWTSIRFEPGSPQYSAIRIYSDAPDSPGLFLTTTALCVQDTKTWLKSRSEMEEEAVFLPVFEIIPSLSAHLQPKLDIKRIPITIEALLRYSPKELRKLKRGRFQITMNDERFRMWPVLDSQLPVCNETKK
ncbi:MAG: hypothetical protein A3K03_11100 [Bdellovibrionales bacterium RIFOXYD1_FULL_44_7]|nr:MAG: hypothetical protein A3K03_11100 [Bdellovibrionales bacterium RIFOXYD1_FULL_44_7]